jgi:alkanesulfonate monooxygenase SsuD/methylene tetrahydromethanopterin reductase-like flavin-dependent oxidoreductase (luciferase family)
VPGYGDRLGLTERSILDQALGASIVGSREIVQQGLERFAAETGANELMVTSQIFDHAARLRSFEITAGAGEALGRREEAPVPVG